MPIWLIYSLLSVTFLAGSEISQKISLSQKVDISAITNNFFVWTLQGSIGLILAFLFGQFSVELSDVSPWRLLLISIVYFAGGTFFYTSYKGNSPSISIILGTISVIVSSILGSIFLADTYSSMIVLGIILILSSIFILNINKKERISKYNFYAIVGGLCFGIAFTIDKSIVSSISPFMYLGFMSLGVAIVSALIGFRTIIMETRRLVTKNFIPMASSASFGSAFNLFTFYAYINGASVGSADAINNTMIFLVIILEIVLLRDRTDLRRKLLCAILATTGVILIGFSKE